MTRFCLLLLLGVSLSASGHSGGTDSSGCHTNRKTGDYHCHNAKLKQPASISSSTTCCKICSKGKACGNTCIARSRTCYKTSGCACNAGGGGW